MRTTFAGDTLSSVQQVAEAFQARLEYDLRYSREGKQWELLTARGRKAPEWFESVPELLPNESYYLEAFWALTTDRQAGMSTGPIPWSSVQRYGEAKGLDSANIEALHMIVRAMDNTFLGFVQDEQERQRKAAETK
jgi:hypothetical protein